MTANPPLVAIGIPAGDRAHTEFMQSIWGLGRGARTYRQGLVVARSSIVANGRNQCVDGMFKVEARPSSSLSNSPRK